MFFATLVLSNLSTALLVSVCVVCIVVDLVGWVWVLNPHSGSVTEGDYGVQINAVSVVNLVRATPGAPPDPPLGPVACPRPYPCECACA